IDVAFDPQPPVARVHLRLDEVTADEELRHRGDETFQRRKPELQVLGTLLPDDKSLAIGFARGILAAPDDPFEPIGHGSPSFPPARPALWFHDKREGRV